MQIYKKKTTKLQYCECQCLGSEDGQDITGILWPLKTDYPAGMS